VTYINILGDFVHRTSYADLPKDVIDCAKSRFIDFLSVLFSGYRSGLHKPFLRIHQGSAGERQATVIGEGVRIYWPHAALVNSSMCPADMTDGSRFAGLHPSSIVIPAALATFEANASHGKILTGKDLLTAIVLGYELMIRIGQVMNPSAVKRGFHLTPVVGPLASAATAGKIMDLDPPRLKNALSIATTLGAGLFDAFKASEPFVEIQIARSCEAGIFAAAMAKEGVPGNDEILEKAFIPAHSDKYRLEFISENLSKSYRISQTYTKIHGGCRHIHAPIDATLAIVNANKIRWDDIEKIAVKTYSIARTLEIEHPETGDDAKFNMAFGISVALIRGNALPDQFTTENLKDVQIQGLMKKVVVETYPDLDKDYPVKRGTIVEVTTKGGETFSQALDLARGEPEFPMTREETNGKFKQLTAGLIPEAQAAKILEFIDTIEDRKELGDLFAYLKVRT
jgi:2-methylcitrate dehydratase PrpD